MLLCDQWANVARDDSVGMINLFTRRDSPNAPPTLSRLERGEKKRKILNNNTPVLLTGMLTDAPHLCQSVISVSLKPLSTVHNQVECGAHQPTWSESRQNASTLWCPPAQKNIHGASLRSLLTTSAPCPRHLPCTGAFLL